MKRTWRLARCAAFLCQTPLLLGQVEPSGPPRADEPTTSAGPPHPLDDAAADEWLEAAHLLDEREPEALIVPPRLTAPPLASCQSLPKEQDWIAAAHKREDGKYVARLGAAERVLTLDASLQDALQKILRSYQTPYGAVVALEPASGRVLAMAEHSAQQPGLHGLTTRAVFPAASIFKIITASALLESGIAPAASECFHGGKRRISEKLLLDSNRDRRCYSLSTALAMSANGVFAKLAFKHLSSEQLRAAAEAFHFNRPWDFPVPTDTSLAAIPADPLGLASAASGFGDVYLSPLHGAAIAASIANLGQWRRPVLLEGEIPGVPAPEQVVSEVVAGELADMLEETVTSGTARRIFRERGFRLHSAVGKTGSLADRHPYREYSWFVGFAPKVSAQVAVAAVIVNDAKWRIRATWLAREAMRLYLQEKGALSGRR